MKTRSKKQNIDQRFLIGLLLLIALMVVVTSVYFSTFSMNAYLTYDTYDSYENGYDSNDINKDGIFNIKDITYVLETSFNKKIIDYDQDGDIDLQDISAWAKKLLGEQEPPTATPIIECSDAKMVYDGDCYVGGGDYFDEDLTVAYTQELSDCESGYFRCLMKQYQDEYNPNWKRCKEQGELADKYCILDSELLLEKCKVKVCMSRSVTPPSTPMPEPIPDDVSVIPGISVNTVSGTWAEVCSYEEFENSGTDDNPHMVPSDSGDCSDQFTNLGPGEWKCEAEGAIDITNYYCHE